jgi:peptidyl-prolyl cis-trans isomerase B (cyclophilin B)
MGRRTLGLIGTGLTLALFGAGLAGCSEGTPVPEVLSEDKPAQQAEARPAAAPDARLHQSFADATRSEPPADYQRPPDTTLTGAATGKLYTEVVQSWDAIKFVSDGGKPLAYTVTLETDLGPIEVALRPDLAPNHVRNFLALARVGFYDGLVFQRTVKVKAEGQDEFQLIEGGCPLGTGEIGHGSIGYWLKPEFNDEPHVEGTVGACHGEDPDSAACKFYVTLTKAPLLDKNFTVFGKVTKGLDVARMILVRPVRTDGEYPEGDRPEKPVVIRKVKVAAREVENAGQGAARE